VELWELTISPTQLSPLMELTVDIHRSTPLPVEPQAVKVVSGFDPTRQQSPHRLTVVKVE
jgi:hypothetical protein